MWHMSDELRYIITPFQTVLTHYFFPSIGIEKSSASKSNRVTRFIIPWAWWYWSCIEWFRHLVEPVLPSSKFIQSGSWSQWREVSGWSDPTSGALQDYWRNSTLTAFQLLAIQFFFKPFWSFGIEEFGKDHEGDMQDSYYVLLSHTWYDYSNNIGWVVTPRRRVTISLSVITILE